MSWKKLEWTSENGLLNLTPLGWDVHKTPNINDPLLRAKCRDPNLGLISIPLWRARRHEATGAHRSHWGFCNSRDTVLYVVCRCFEENRYLHQRAAGSTPARPTIFIKHLPGTCHYRLSRL